MHLLAALVALSLTAEPKTPAPVFNDPKTNAAVTEKAKALVATLGARDAKALSALFAVGPVTMLGADVAETCADVLCVERNAKDLFALVDVAKYGELKGLSVQSSASLATAFFDVNADLTTGKEKKSQLVRLATTWRFENGDWRLVQLLRSVPTVSRSARELVKENELK